MKNNIACRIPDSPPTDAVAAGIWQLNHKRRHLLLVDRSVSDSRLVGTVGVEPTISTLSEWQTNQSLCVPIKISRSSFSNVV